MTPLLVSAGSLVPCGKCPACRKRKISEWSFRLMQQDMDAASSVFITLTYDTAHVPISPRGFMSISKRDCQLFFKRLRKAHPVGWRFKYYLCGEYGSRSWRPHYHALLFGADKNLIQNAWKVGSIHYGQVSGASVGYTLKYMSKKGKIPLHANDDRVREFALMSKGLGLGYLSEAMVRYHHVSPEERFFLTLDDGKKVSMPRYYKLKLFTDEQRKAISAAVAAIRPWKLPGCASSPEKEAAVRAAFRAYDRRAGEGDSL